MTQKEIEAVKVILKYIGEDPDREGLEDTPKRFLKAWKEYWGAGYTKELQEFNKTFEDGAENADEMVIVKDIPIYSHCEHHIAPIVGVCHIAYIPKGRVIGLSKLARIADMFARRLQVQERLTNQIADSILELLECEGVGVAIEAEHFCMSSRGVRVSNSKTVTSALRGVFKDEQKTRAEFLSLIK